MNSLIRCVSTAFVIALLSLGMTSANAGFFDDLAESADQLRRTAEDISQLGKNHDKEPGRKPEPEPEYRPVESSQNKVPTVDSTNASESSNNYNNSNTHVASAQKLLNQLGYDVGPADGVYGQNTANGIQAYQRDKGLPAHGNVTAELLAILSQDNRNSSKQSSSTSQPTQGFNNENDTQNESVSKSPQKKQTLVSGKDFPAALVFDRPTSGKSCIELHSNCRDTLLRRQKTGEISSNQFASWFKICNQQLEKCFASQINDNTSEASPLISRHIMELIDGCRYGSSTSRRFNCDCIEREYKQIHAGNPKNQEYNDYNAALAQCVDPKKTYNYAYDSCISSADLILKQQTGNKSSKKEFCECTAVEYRSGLIAAAGVPSANVGDSQFNRRLLTSSFEKCL